MITKTVCDYCGEEFTYELFPSMKPRRFCSRSCSASWNNTHDPKRKPTYRCKHCEQLIHGRTSATHVYCSPECREAAKLERPEPRTPYESIRAYRRRMKKELAELLGGKCAVCGYSRCVVALEFHHLDPEKKDFNIGAKIQAHAKAIEEVKKCVLLCSNCHREFHAGLIDLAALGIEPRTSALSEQNSTVELGG